jgi:glycosyltransferase involved in cell wall biosynthesis
MKVLQLCHRIPFPANDGGNIAMLAMADGLVSQGARVKMLALNTLKHWVDPESLPSKITSDYQLESVRIDTSVRAQDALLNLFSGESYNVKRFYSDAFESKLSEVLKNDTFDVILLESLFMAPYIETAREFSKAKIVLRSHNVEHVIWQRLAANEKNPLKKFYLRILSKRLRKYEIETLVDIDAMLPITYEDKSFFSKLGFRKPMLTVPVGIDMSQYADQAEESSTLCLFHIGSMDWRPNYEGVTWFLQEVWPLIHKKFPALKLFLAGRNFPEEIIARKDPNVFCEGEVKDAQAFMQGKQIMVVPLKSGGGMRVKIVQGLALGKTIISTSVGAEGIDYTNEKNILIADTPAAFVSAVERCLADKSFCFNIGREARNLAIVNYSNEMIGKKVVSFLQVLATKSQRH